MDVNNSDILDAFDSAADDIASAIYGKYCDLGLGAVEREVFMSEIFERLAKLLQERDGEKLRVPATDERKSLL